MYKIQTRHGVQMLQSKGLATSMVMGLTAALATAGMQSAYAVDGIAISGQTSYTEQADAVAVDPGLAITSPTGFAGKYVQAQITSTVSGETLSLIEDASPDNTSGVVTIVDGKVHVGKGSSTEIVGEIDSTRTGANGTL